MDFELHPAVSLKPRSFNVLVSPRQTFIDMLNRNPNLQRFKILYVSGNFSGILSQLHRTFTELEVRRGFTTFQIMTILDENYHPFRVVEHNLPLYERARDMAGHVAHALKQASRGGILLYAPALDRHLETMAEYADRVFCFYDVQGALGLKQVRSIPEIAGQTTWEAFS